MKRVKRALKKLNSAGNKGVEKRVEEAKSALKLVQEQMRMPTVNQVLHQEEEKYRRNQEKWINIQESIMQKKSRVQWLRLGDSNSSYFHACLKNRQAQNTIRKLVNAAGDLLQTPAEVESEIIEFYKDLLGKSAATLPAVNTQIMKEGYNKQQQLALIKPVSCDEVKLAISSINDTKAPGSDGFKVVFYKRAWNIIGEDIIQAVIDTFKKAEMFQPINCTSITLVPKVRNPATIKELRPISCCNVLYKIISKVLTARL